MNKKVELLNLIVEIHVATYQWAGSAIIVAVSVLHSCNMIFTISRNNFMCEAVSLEQQKLLRWCFNSLNITVSICAQWVVFSSELGIYVCFQLGKSSGYDGINFTQFTLNHFHYIMQWAIWLQFERVLGILWVQSHSPDINSIYWWMTDDQMLSLYWIIFFMWLTVTVSLINILSFVSCS